MLNFLDPKLFPKVSCNYPVSDGYEASNLISDKYNNRARGFIAYPTIKPPVEIEFELLCYVNIHYMVLNTTVGSHNSTGIEIFARCDVASGWISICRGFYDEPGIVFCNSKFYSKENVPADFNSTYSLQFFKRDTFRIFLNAKFLKVVIMRTNRSVPCLASIQVCGVPSRNCSQKTKDTIRRLTSQAVVLNTPSVTIVDEFKVPDDFKDDLTYELMTIPMTLPCGKTVDQITLEKHNSSETSFGRRPCDPFTGVKFTDRLKPVLNVALKSRIDMFLLQNSERPEFRNLKRTVGGVPKSRVIHDTAEKSSVTDPKNSKRICGLDDLIANAKRSKHFVNFSEVNKRNICQGCQSELNFLYEISCKHLFCRPCLFEIRTSSKCSDCGRSFNSSDVRKCNF